MFNSKIKLFTRNILETGTFTVTGDADSGYPEARLHDREISLYWKDASADKVQFIVDQGVSPVAVDSLIINSHDFDGYYMAWQYSDNSFYWVDAVEKWIQDGNSQIVKTFTTALTKRYWRVVLSDTTITTTTTTTSSSSTSSTASTTSSSSSTSSTQSTTSSSSSSTSSTASTTSTMSSTSTTTTTA